MSNNTESTAVSTHVQAFTHIEAAVAAFEKRHKDVVHDCKTTEGDKAARKDRQEVQQHISSIEAKRVELTEPHLTAQREIMAIAKGYTARLTTLKANYDTQIKAEETRKAEIKRKAELEAQRKRDEAAAAERAAAAKREQELREQNERLQAELAAAKAAAAPAPVPQGWDRIEADEEPQREPTKRYIVMLDRAANVPAAHDDGLLDLLDAGTSHANMAEARDTRPVAPLKLPTAHEVADALSEAARKRTNIRHVVDVLEALRKIMGAA